MMISPTTPGAASGPAVGIDARPVDGLTAMLSDFSSANLPNCDHWMPRLRIRSALARMIYALMCTWRDCLSSISMISIVSFIFCGVVVTVTCRIRWSTCMRPIPSTMMSFSMVSTSSTSAYFISNVRVTTSTSTASTYASTRLIPSGMSETISLLVRRSVVAMPCCVSRYVTSSSTASASTY